MTPLAAEHKPLERKPPENRISLLPSSEAALFRML